MSEEIKTNKTNVQDKKRNTGIIMAAVAVVILAAVVGMGIYNAPANRIARLLDLGQKYLLEEDYEQAVLAFSEAIEIDPKCEQAYLGAADAYIGLGDFESAQEILAQASELMETTQITEKMEYVAALRAEQYKADMVEKADEPKAKEPAKPEAGAKETQTAEIETKAEEMPAEPVSTEQALVAETPAEETSTAPVNEETVKPTEPGLPTPELETGGTWIDGVYNNLVTGNHMPVVEMLKNRAAWYNFDAFKPYQTYLGDGMDDEGHEMGATKYRLTTSSGKSVYFESRYGMLLIDAAKITGENLSFYYVDQGQDGNTYGWYNSIGYGCYMVSYTDTGKYEWLVGNAMYDSEGKAQILHEGEVFNIW